MSEEKFDDLKDLYTSLCDLNHLPKRIIEKSDSATAKFLVTECKLQLNLVERREFMELTSILIELRDLLDSISFLKSFKSSCENSTKYVQLYLTARRGFNNTLPELEKDVNLVIDQMSKCMDVLYETPFHQILNIEKITLFQKLLEMFEANEVKYLDYDTHFEGLFLFLDRKRQRHDTASSREQYKYTYEDIKNVDDRFLNSIANASSTVSKEKVKASVMKTVLFWSAKKDEQTALFDGFDRFYGNLENMRKCFKNFETLFDPFMFQSHNYILRLKDLDSFFKDL